MLKLSDRSFLGELAESPFALFVTMEMERDNIYSEYSEIDEIHEISDEWMRFSVSCAKSLNLVAILSQLLHERYYDELSKDQERIAKDGDRFDSITRRIQGIIQLEAESSLLMLTYANIRNTGVFGQTPPAGFCDYYLSALSHLDRIQELFFVYEHPRLPEINKILRSLSTLEKTKRILPYLDLLDDKNSDFAIKERGIYEITEGSFNSEVLGEFINEVGGDSPTSYWWPDSITEHFVFSKAVEHLEKAAELWKNAPADLRRQSEIINLVKIPLNKASANNALAKHYHRLGIDAGIKGAYRISSNYFKYVESLSTNALQMTEHLVDTEGGDKQRIIDVHQASEKREDLSSLMSGISDLTIRFQTEINNITQDEKFQSKEEVWSSIQEDADNLAKGDLPYISLIPIMYQNIANVSQLIVKNELSSSKIVETTEKVVGQFMQRLISGTEIVLVSWKEITSQERSTMRQKLEDLLITIKYLTQALALMPKIAKPRIRTINRLRSMRYLIESVIVELDSSSLETGNRVLELILKAKAHFFATKARALAEELPEGDVPLDQIKANYSGTYISGIQIQMNIFQLTAQYAVLNYVLITLLDTLSITKEKEKDVTTEQILEEVEKDFEATKMFERMLERIRDDCTSLLIHRRKEGDVVKGVPWESFARREKLIQGVLLFYNAIKEASRGQVKALFDMGLEARGHYEDAQKSSFDAATILGEAMEGITGDHAQVPQHVFSFGQMCQENVQKTKDGKEVTPIPSRDLFRLFRDLVFIV